MTTLTTKPMALVTGASSGIGLELATQLAQHGFDLIVVAEDGEIMDAALQLQTLGANVQPIQADLTFPDTIDTVYGVVMAQESPLEVLAINAGVGVGGSFLSTDLAAEVKMIEVNVVSTVALAKRLLPDMKARGRGRVLFTSSIAAVMPTPFEAVYGATKAFVLSFAAALRDELKDSGVTVTSLLPGPTETNFFHRAGLDNTKVGRSQKDDAQQVAKQALRALMAGEERVNAGGVKSRLIGAASRFLPEVVKARWHHQMAKPQPRA